MFVCVPVIACGILSNSHACCVVTSCGVKCVLIVCISVFVYKVTSAHSRNISKHALDRHIDVAFIQTKYFKDDN